MPLLPPLFNDVETRVHEEKVYLLTKQGHTVSQPLHSLSSLPHPPAVSAK